MNTHPTNTLARPRRTRRLVAAAALAAGALLATPAVASAGPGHAPADGRCVAQGAGFTFDGPTKAAVAQGGLMSFVILDHAFNNANETEALLGVEICP